MGFEYSSRNIRCHSKSQFSSALNEIQFSVFFSPEKLFVNIWNFSEKKIRDFSGWIFPVGIQLTIVTHLFFCAGVSYRSPMNSIHRTRNSTYMSRKCIRDH